MKTVYSKIFAALTAAALITCFAAGCSKNESLYRESTGSATESSITESSTESTDNSAKETTDKTESRSQESTAESAAAPETSEDNSKPAPAETSKETPAPESKASQTQTSKPAAETSKTEKKPAVPSYSVSDIAGSWTHSSGRGYVDITLNDDMTATMNSDELYRTLKGKWKIKTNQVTVSICGSKHVYTYENGSLKRNDDNNVILVRGTTGVSDESKEVLSRTYVKTGTKVTIDGTKTGNGDYNYAFYYKKSSSRNYVKIETKEGAKKASFIPKSTDIYNIRVAAYTTSEGDGYEKKYDLIVTSGDPVVNTSSISSSDVSTGTRVNLAGSAYGGTNVFKYAYYLRKSGDSNWTAISSGSSDPANDFGDSESAFFTPGFAAVYDVRIVALDAGGKYAEQTFVVNVS